MRLAAVFLLATSLTLPSAGDDPPPPGEVELHVRGPDGRPKAAIEISVHSFERQVPGGEHALRATARTDRDGIAKFEWPTGVWRMMIAAKGVGYATTGLVEVIPGRPAGIRPVTLVPFAMIEGAVPKDLLSSGAQFHVNMHENWSPLKSVTIEKDDRFRAELPAGRCSVCVLRGLEVLAQLPKSLSLAPGQKVDGLNLIPVPPDQRRIEEGTSVGMLPGRGQIVTWARGIVRDSKGRAVARAKVWALGTYFDGMRTGEWLKETSTDMEGRYEFKGDGGLQKLSLSLVAHVPGRPPTWAWTPQSGGMIFAPEGTPEPPLPPPPVVDLVVPDTGGRLEVTVVQDGKPAAGVTVGVWNECVKLQGERGIGHDARSLDFEEVVCPMATTDAAGKAKFEALLPGQYSIIAGDTDRIRERRDRSPFQKPGTVGIADSVPVSLGRTTEFRIAIYPQPNETRLQGRKADGQPLAGSHVPFDYGPVGATHWRSSSLPMATKEFGRPVFDSPGLWRALLTFRDSPTRWIPIREVPYYRAEGVVAVSSLLPADEIEPAILTARRFDPGSIVVELRDAAGRPVQGYVQLDRWGRDPQFIGPTDETGTVRFENVPGEMGYDGHIAPYLARIVTAGKSGFDIDDRIAPMPTERQLTGRSMFFPAPVAAEPNTEKRIVLREQPIGFILGRLRPPDGYKTNDFYVTFHDDPWPERVTIRQEISGDFVGGPFPAGPVRLRLWNYDPNGAGAAIDVEQREVKIEPGKVMRVELAPTAEDLQRLTKWRAKPDKPISLEGRVLLPGGKEPAFGATVWCFVPGYRLPAACGVTDANGQMRSKPVVDTGERPFTAPPDEFTEPTIIALLPGTHGASFVQPTEEPFKIELPPSMTVRGRVIVGGTEPSRLTGRIRVLAVIEGRGDKRFGRILNVQTTAQVGGEFELGGLTPARYRIQAALDDIWLSPSVLVDFTKQEPKELVMAIPAPGGPATVKVINADGSPALGRAFALDRPSGPLASIFWPREWTTDGAGKIRIPALEAGKHTLRLKGSPLSAEVVVPALPAVRAFEIEMRITP